MAKLPDHRRPFDPAKAARDRAASQPAVAPPMTLKQRMAARRPLLLPEKPKAGSADEE